MNRHHLVVIRFPLALYRASLADAKREGISFSDYTRLSVAARVERRRDTRAARRRKA